MKVPAAQDEHDDEPVTAAYLPTSQSTQTAAAAADRLSTGQAQAATPTEPSDAENEPLSHDLHAVCPDVSWYWPAAHRLQVDEAAAEAWIEPAAHDLQAVEPVES